MGNLMSNAIQQRELTEAFLAFGELSGSLEKSYRELEGQVQRLTAELASTRRSRATLAGRFERLLEVLPGGVLLLDGQGIVQDCNPAAVALLGEPLMGESWERICARAILPGSVFGGEIVLASGRRASLSQRTLAGEAGRIILISDVTEAHLVRELTARSQRLSALGEMAARLAHQLRTPLSAALLYASRLAGQGHSVEETRSLAGKTTARLRDLERLIGDMLNYAGGGGGARVRTSVSAVLEGVAQILAGRLRQGGRLTLRTSAPALVIEASADALTGAIANLAVNALDLGGPEVTIVVEASEPVAGLARIRVSDDGPGVPAAIRERIFEPFFTTRPGGTGLGLAVVASVVHAHGGEVRLEDTPCGATFTVELPTAPLAQSGETVHAPS